jgi:transposase-like protein
MPITATNPFKGRHYPGEVILLCVRWYLRFPLAYEHVAEILGERGVEVMPVAFGAGSRRMRPS